MNKKTRYWFVWNQSGGTPPKRRHRSYKDARQEALRLANKHRGETFHVLEVVGKARVAQDAIYYTFD